MNKYEVGEIVKGTVSGIEAYGAFVSLNEYYTGMIHISEFKNGYVKDINDYIKVGDEIKAKIIGIDEEHGHLKLSIKDMPYNARKHARKTKIVEMGTGFKGLEDKLPEWIENYKEKI